MRLADTVHLGTNFPVACVCPGDLPFLEFGTSRPSVFSQGRRSQTPLPRQSLEFTLRKPEWEKTLENTHLTDRMFSKSVQSRGSALLFSFPFLFLPLCSLAYFGDELQRSGAETTQIVRREKITFVKV